MSASSKITIGPLPPSSSMTCLPAARRATERPVSVEPTNPTPAIKGWPAIRKYSMASPTSPTASALYGLPWSRLSQWASSSRRLSITSAIRCNNVARSKAPSEAMAGRARYAASTARLASARVPLGNWAITSPLAGLLASKVSPPSDSTHRPSTNILSVSTLSATFIPLPPVDSDPGVENRVSAHLDERLELFIDARVDSRILVVGEELFPLLVRHLVRGARSHPLPAVIVFGRGNPWPIETGPVVAHRMLGTQVMTAGTDFTDPVHREPFIVEGDPPGEDPLEHAQGFHVDDEFLIGRQQRTFQPARGVKDEVNPTHHRGPHAHHRLVGRLRIR